MEEKIIISNSTVLCSRKIKSKNIYLAKFLDTMFMVIAFVDNKKVYSRSFAFNKKNKNIVFKEAKQIYKFIVDCFYKNNIDLLEEI